MAIRPEACPRSVSLPLGPGLATWSGGLSRPSGPLGMPWPPWEFAWAPTSLAPTEWGCHTPQNLHHPIIWAACGGGAEIPSRGAWQKPSLARRTRSSLDHAWRAVREEIFDRARCPIKWLLHRGYSTYPESYHHGIRSLGRPSRKIGIHSGIESPWVNAYGQVETSTEDGEGGALGGEKERGGRVDLWRRGKKLVGGDTH